LLVIAGFDSMAKHGYYAFTFDSFHRESYKRVALMAKAFKREELLQRITIDPNICFGKPCIRGHRIWVSLIVDLLASGATIQKILREYPGLEEADVLACIAYGADVTLHKRLERWS